MVYVNDGIDELQKSLRNETYYFPNYFVFAGSDNTYTGSETEINDNFLQKDITWTTSGLNSIYTAQLSSVECVGSYIGTIGLIGSDATGSSLITIDESFIASKTNNFNVGVEGEIIIRRFSSLWSNL